MTPDHRMSERMPLPIAEIVPILICPTPEGKSGLGMLGFVNDVLHGQVNLDDQAPSQDTAVSR